MADITRSEAASARDEALRQVDEHADARWKADALAAVEGLCRARKDWISDDVWETGLESTREDRALGPILRTAARNGWCRKTDRVRPSKRSHLSGKPVWESLIYEEPWPTAESTPVASAAAELTGF
jgi:hypothetical protein